MAIAHSDHTNNYQAEGYVHRSTMTSIANVFTCPVSSSSRSLVIANSRTPEPLSRLRHNHPHAVSAEP